MILRLYRTSGSVDIQRSDRAGILEGEEAEVACRGPRYRRHARLPHWRRPGGWRSVIGRRRTATPGPRRVAAGAAVTGGPVSERQVCAPLAVT